MMRAACCPAARIIELRDVATPAPAAGEVVVRVRVCGICGSDLHWFTGHAALPPVCPGHEMAGEVAAVGAGVSGWRAGDRVAVEPLRSCGVCRYCRHRTPQLCVRLQIFGLQLAGGFADAVVVPATALFAVPPQLDWPIAVLAEPTAVAVHAVRLAGIAAGQRVLILGAGAIGLLCVLAASAAGAEVWVSARYAHQAALARRLGAARVFATSETAQAERRALAAEHGIDVVLETVGGDGDTLADAVHSVRPGGTVVVLGVFTGTPALPALTVLVKEVRLVGSMTYDRRGEPVDFAAALALLAADRARVAPLVTHRFALPEIQRAFDTAADKRSGAVKVCVAAD